MRLAAALGVALLVALPGSAGAGTVSLRPRAAAASEAGASVVEVDAELARSAPRRASGRRLAAAAEARGVLARADAIAEPRGTELRSRGEGSLTADERARRDAAIDALVAAEALATESPETAEGPLQDALDRFTDVAPLVSDDARAQDARAFALLALARTRLVLERPSDAQAALDEAIATVRGRPLPVDQFGPALEALFQQRSGALAAMPPASLSVRCSVQCRVLVDEQPFTDVLPPGVHRVWVEALAPGQPVLRRTLRLSPGLAIEVIYEVEVPEPTRTEPARTPEPPRRRIVPRWVSVLGLATGTSVAVAGGVLVGVDHRCPDLADPREVPCLRILNTDTTGYALIGVGAASAISAAVILAIDEVRARKRR